MVRTMATNGSPQADKGDTARLFTPFALGMTDADAEVKLLFAARLKVRPCSCGEMYCWFQKPGVCCLKDDTQGLYPNASPKNWRRMRA